MYIQYICIRRIFAQYLKTDGCGSNPMEEEEFWDEPEENYGKDFVDLESDDEDELFEDFGEDGSYGDEDY